MTPNPTPDLLPYLAGRRKTIEASIATEQLAGNSFKETCERTALAEITALECELQKWNTRAQPKVQIEASHPEATCEDCCGPNVVWFAPSPLWNRVARNSDGSDPMLCPRCFALRAFRAGLDKTWIFTSDDDQLRILEDNASLQTQLTESRAEVERLKWLAGSWKNRDTFIFESVGECHLMISRNNTAYSKEKFDACSLPARVAKVIAERDQLRQQFEELKTQAAESFQHAEAEARAHDDKHAIAVRWQDKALLAESNLELARKALEDIAGTGSMSQSLRAWQICTETARQTLKTISGENKQ